MYMIALLYDMHFYFYRGSLIMALRSASRLLVNSQRAVLEKL